MILPPGIQAVSMNTYILHGALCAPITSCVHRPLYRFLRVVKVTGNTNHLVDAEDSGMYRVDSGKTTSKSLRLYWRMYVIRPDEGDRCRPPTRISRP